MVVTQEQGSVAGGQLRGGDQFLDFRPFGRPGTALAILAPLCPGGFDKMIPASPKPLPRTMRR